MKLRVTLEMSPADSRLVSSGGLESLGGLGGGGIRGGMPRGELSMGMDPPVEREAKCREGEVSVRMCLRVREGTDKAWRPSSVVPVT